MAEFLIWVVGITIGVAFCLFILSLPAIFDLLGDLKESRYLIVSTIAWILWIIVGLTLVAIIISVIIATLGAARDLVQYIFKE